ncbi:MAG: beta-lactamase family protein [Phycisphaerales bacterium]|nr:beta-lactamase family protein [Phycisphaerales bacterium]
MLKRGLRVIIVLLSLIPATAVLAQNRAAAPQPYTDSATIPDTAAYRRAREIVELVNGGDAEKVRAFIDGQFAAEFRDAMPMAEHLDMFERVHADSGELEVYGARSYTPPRPVTQAVLVLRSKLEESWRAVVVDVEEAEPHRVASLMFAQARPPSNLPKGERLSDAQIAEAMKGYVERLAAADGFSGTVLLARDGEVFFTAAVGIANRDFGAPVRLDTKFNLGSMNKMFTGVAAAQLAQAGKLSMEDAVGKYLGEDWLPREALDGVQVQHLLTHTSGLGSYFNETFDRSSRALYRGVEDYRPLTKGETLAFSAGTQWRYSNTGMLVAGAVIEKASGEDYFEYIRAYITGPAGMVNTDCYELDRVNPNLAVGYVKEKGPAGTEYRNNLFMHVMRGGPAGGGYSTVEDLLRFDRALRGGKLLSKEWLDRVWSAHPEVGSPRYGYGFGIEDGPAGRIVGHNGGFPGISAALAMYVDTGYTIAVLSNYGGAAEMVKNKAAELIAQGR